MAKAPGSSLRARFPPSEESFAPFSGAVAQLQAFHRMSPTLTGSDFQERESRAGRLDGLSWIEALTRQVGWQDDAISWSLDRTAHRGAHHALDHFVHHDLHWGQYLEEGGQAILLDWSDAGAGDPLDDLAALLARCWETEGVLWMHLIRSSYQKDWRLSEQQDFLAMTICRLISNALGALNDGQEEKASLRRSRAQELWQQALQTL